jgi:phosphoribosylglycinamide formyltransferase-1
MEKIFFPLPVVGFSGLCKIVISHCHVFVSIIVDAISFKKEIFRAQFFPFIFILQPRIGNPFGFCRSVPDNILTMPDLPSAVKLAIFASGAGSNAQNIIEYFRHHDFIKIGLIVCNNPLAGVLAIAEKEKIPSLLIEKARFFNGDGYLETLAEKGIGFIVLAGFLWKVPLSLIRAFNGRIINIHPALLPGYGGKGMYGKHVHEAVIRDKKKESGITIHYVDEVYDHGNIIFQAKCGLDENDTPGSLAEKIHLLEHRWFPEIIEKSIVSENIVKRS